MYTMAYTDWKIGNLIGAGGQAQVFIATRENDEMVYAIKIFTNNKRVERSKTEILNMQSLKVLNINVPEIYDHGEYKNDRPYFVTQYYKNKSLQDEFENGLLNINKIVFAKKLCNEIKKMNNVGYIHRDLKPANILLDNEFNPIIADFGLSNNTDEETGYTKTGEPIGSTHYIHPKAFEAKSIEKKLHIGFDAYSFGKILFELLTGIKLLGFSKPENIEVFNDSIEDNYIANKIFRSINKLLTNDLKELVNYWHLFPSELDHIFSPPYESSDLDENTSKMLRDYFSNNFEFSIEPSIKNTIQPDEIKDEVMNFLKECKSLLFINNLMNELKEKNKVEIIENINIREVLEGVGVKSNYGIEPIRVIGRKQSLVKTEMLIVLPKSNKKIGISILTSTPFTTIILCRILKNNDWVDICQKSIKKIDIDENSRIEKNYLSIIENYILKSLN
jgi:serine/threonine protein kinase